MNTLILNRAGQLPADGWYEIETAGDHPNAAAGIVQRLDGTAFDAIVNRFKARAAQPNFGGLLIDQDHFSLDTSKSSEAFGWLKELRNRDGHLEGRIEWTDLGKPAVEGQRYKFFSTVYEPKPVEKVGTAKIANRTVPLVRPLILDRLALTNDPNNKGGKPISNRDGNPAGAADENENKPTMKSLLKKLGLAEDASEESAVAALQAIQNRASQVDALTTERDTLLAAQVESDLEKYKNRFKATERERWKKALIANRASTIELLESIEEPAAGKDGKKPITNRGTATPPADGVAADDKDAQAAEARAAKIQNRARELRAADKSLSLSKSYEAAEAELDAAAAK
jgi:hypothetical protein